VMSLIIMRERWRLTSPFTCAHVLVVSFRFASVPLLLSLTSFFPSSSPSSSCHHPLSLIILSPSSFFWHEQHSTSCPSKHQKSGCHPSVSYARRRYSRNDQPRARRLSHNLPEILLGLRKVRKTFKTNLRLSQN